MRSWVLVFILFICTPVWAGEPAFSSKEPPGKISGAGSPGKKFATTGAEYKPEFGTGNAGSVTALPRNQSLFPPGISPEPGAGAFTQPPNSAAGESGNNQVAPERGNSTAFIVAAGLALLPAFFFSLFFVQQMLTGGLRSDQAHRRLIFASCAAISLTVLIILGDSLYFFLAGRAVNSGQVAGFDFDFDGRKCNLEKRAAQEALSRQDYDSALLHINRALHYNTRGSDLRTTRAIINASAGRIGEAVTELNAVLKDQPQDAQALLARCRAYYMSRDYERAASDAAGLVSAKKYEAEAGLLLARVKILSGDFAGALVELDKVLAHEAGNNAAFACKGDCYFHCRNYQAALHAYDSAIKPSGNSGELLFKRGRCLYQLGFYQEAADDLIQSVRESPGSVEYRRALAQVYLKQNRLPLALDELDQALHQDPYDQEALSAARLTAEQLEKEAQAQLQENHNNATAQTALAYALYMLKSYDAALRAAGAAIILDGKNARSFFLAGECAIEAKQYKQAIAFLDRALQLEPKNINACFEIARAQSAMELFPESINNYSRFLAACPEHSKSAGYVARAMCYMSLRDFKNAIADLSTGLKYSPDNAEVYALRGYACGCLADGTRARQDLQTALRIDPNRPLCRRNFVCEMLREGKFVEALAAAKQAVSARPKDPVMHSLLSQVFWLMGDYQQSLNEATVAVELDPNNAKTKSQQAAAFWVLDQTGELRVACDFLKNSLEGKDKGQESADVYFSGLWPYIFYSSLQDRPNAQKVLAAVSARTRAKSWPYPVFQYMQHKISESDLLKQKVDLWSLTEIHCYVGCAQYYAGENQAARQNLKWVVDKGRKDFLEYMLAQAIVRKNNW